MCVCDARLDKSMCIGVYDCGSKVIYEEREIQTLNLVVKLTPFKKN